MERLLDGARVVERQARVLGQREQDLLVPGAEEPAWFGRRHSQAADDVAALVHRSRHGGRRHGDRKIHQVAQRTGSRHGVRDDEHPFAHGASAKSRAGGLPPALGHELVVPPESGHCRRMVRIVRVGDPKDSHAAVQQLARPLHHGLQDLVDGEPIDDPAL